MKTDAVLFDLDGTLINSMDLHYACWCEILRRHGKKIERADFFRLEGSNIYKLMSTLLDFPDGPTVKELIKLKDNLFCERFTFDLYPGVLDLITLFVRNDLRLGIVTASSRERFYKTVPSSFYRYFDCVVTGDDLPVGKPSPEVYLEGARRLRYASDRILVIENAPLGVMSALGAGMRCMVVGNTLPRKDFPDSVKYFKTNLELLRGMKSEFKESSNNYGQARSGS